MVAIYFTEYRRFRKRQVESSAFSHDPIGRLVNVVPSQFRTGFIRANEVCRGVHGNVMSPSGARQEKTFLLIDSFPTFLWDQTSDVLFHSVKMPRVMRCVRLRIDT